ncbi:ABC transporter ATP-binding protein [Nocardioides dongxiaopingii]|uniref:ABC transporter ATP-binding protein n=1 Tax=Nocardioides dongxiaopingii TaxID=2576036 RepID=UPI0010C76B2C|nr:ABC transporter ATP-binding protein [Nocardioides dongxiaopingii]
MSTTSIDRRAADPAATAQDVAIQVRGVRKSYGDREVLRGIDLAVRPGEFFGILGPNGAGKTTLVEIIEGLRRPDGGDVEVLGASPHRRRSGLLRRVGVQTQKGAFFTRLTAREHLLTMASLYRVSPVQADRTLALVGLTGQGGVRVEKLSGGQKQRLAIAGALVHEPDVIFLDEPTAALDPQARRDLWTVLRDLRAQGRTIIYTTHHLDEAEALCDRVAILVAGEIRALDTPHLLKAASHGLGQVRVPVGRLDAARGADLVGVVGIRTEGGALVLETERPSDVLLQVSEICALDGVETRTPNLEDVYLELTADQPEHAPQHEEAVR